MKGRFENLVDLATEIERLDNLKKDYIVPGDKMRMKDDKEIVIEGISEMPINDFAHGQLASKLDIPKIYYDKMTEVPGLRTMNVNAWFHKEPEKRVLVRTVEHRARAFLSDKFKPIDNSFVLSALLPAVKDLNGGNGNIKMNTAAITEKTFYLQLLFPKIQAEIKKDNVVCAGLTMSNSEVGCSSFDLEDFIHFYSCSNGMISQSVFRKYHVGRRIGDDIKDYDFYSNDTMMAELNSLKLRLRDTIKHVLTEAHFLERVKTLREANETIITGKVQNVVENVTRQWGFSLKESELLLDNVIKAKEMTKLGIANGITALAHSIEDADRQYDFEKVGYNIITLDKSKWDVLQEEPKKKVAA